MSLILDALNKADRARDPTIPDSGLARASMPSELHGPLIPVWAIVSSLFLLALIAGAAVVAVWQLSVPKAESVVTPPPAVINAEAVVQGAVPASAADVKPLRRPILAADTPSVVPAIAEMYDQASEDYDELYEQAEFLKAANRASSVKTPPETAAEIDKPKAPPVVKSTPNALPSADEIQRMWRETEPQKPAVDAINPYAQLPYLYQLPKSFQERIPTLLYQNHIYSTAASGVIINGTTYRNNDVIAPDLIVLQITENDLVLSYLKRPFKLAALSSWVKMD